MSGAALALALSVAAGWLVTSAVWRVAGHAVVRACLSLGVGLLLASLGELVALERGGGGAATAQSDLAILAGAFGLWLLRRRGARSAFAAQPPLAPANRRLVQGLGAAAAAGALGLSAYALLSQIGTPQGDWDAWAIWNLKARFFARGGPLWSSAFDERLAWSHPDYPLLLPTTVAHLWVHAGSESPLVPAFAAWLFAALGATALAAFLAARQGVATGLAAALALLATPYFVESAAFQIADLPLGCWLLLALGMRSLAERDGAVDRGAHGLAGLCCGAGAWTKNEGSLFVLAVLASLVAVGPRARAHERCAAFLAGAALPLLAVAATKLSLAGQSDLLVGQSFSAIAARVLDPARHARIASSFAEELWSTTGGTVLVTLAALAPLSGSNPDRAARRVAGAGALALAIVVCGYYAVYLASPVDLDFHLQTSNRRLFLQLWPSALFVLFSSLAPLGYDAPLAGGESAWRLHRTGTSATSSTGSTRPFRATRPP